MGAERGVVIHKLIVIGKLYILLLVSPLSYIDKDDISQESISVTVKTG
jgi:hypothetical protein